jgi:DNA-binding response OmpR family regulator
MNILIVEDDVKLAKVLQRGLTQERFSAEIVHNTDDADNLIEPSNYDLIILDWMLPGRWDGAEFCKHLRDINNDTPIIMLTAKNTTKDKITGLNIGADDYLSKPFAFDELVARIRAILRRDSGDRDPVLKFADIELDPISKTVKRAGVDINLSKKEFMVLEYLILNKNTVVSKQQLIDKVWDFESDILQNTVEVYIGYLRNKIEKPFGSKVIKTVRGFGYRLEEANG